MWSISTDKASRGIAGCHLSIFSAPTSGTMQHKGPYLPLTCQSTLIRDFVTSFRKGSHVSASYFNYFKPKINNFQNNISDSSSLTQFHDLSCSTALTRVSSWCCTRQFLVQIVAQYLLKTSSMNQCWVYQAFHKKLKLIATKSKICNDFSYKVVGAIVLCNMCALCRSSHNGFARQVPKKNRFV